MNFHEFTDTIIKGLQHRMGDEYTVTVTKILKNNDIRLTGIIIMEQSDTASPTIYLEEPYQRYQRGVPIRRIMEEIIALYEQHAHTINLDMDFFKDFGRVKDRIFHKVVNFEKNRKLLEDIPYFRWHDLAVIFYYAMEETGVGRASILLHNSHLDMWGQAAEAVYRIAQQNMIHSMPDLLVPMQSLLKEMMGEKLEEQELPLYILTNRERIFGASAMLYSDKLKTLADRLCKNLLILPSSVHEVLLLPDENNKEYDFYRRMVNEVNTTQVDPEEILSDGLYRYNRDKMEIEEIVG